MNGVNLIPGYHLTSQRRRVRSRHWTLGVIGYSLMLLLGWGVLHWSAGGSNRAVASQIEDATARIADITDALNRMKPRLGESLATLAASRSVGEQANWAILLRLVGQRLGENAVLTRCQLEPILSSHSDHSIARRYVLHLEGLSRSHKAVSDYVLSLEQLGLFDSVELNETRREPWGAKTAVAFSLDCTLGEPVDE